MNGKYLLKKMDLVDPEFIDKADKLPRKKPLMLPQWMALCACLALCLISGIWLAIGPGIGNTIETTGETASLFGNGGIALAVMLASLLAAAGIFAYILKKRKK